MKKLGLITALTSEAQCFAKEAKTWPKQQLIEHQNWLIIIAGMGSDNAAKACQQLIKRDVSGIVSWGTAGSLNADLQTGDLLLPRSVRFLAAQSDQERLAFHSDTAWRQQLIDSLHTHLNYSQQVLIQAEQIIANAAEKALIPAHAVDMESATIAKIASQEQIPFLIVRSIVDQHNESLPLSALASVDQFGHSKPFTLMKNLLLHPSDLGKLIRLGLHFRSAQRTLRNTAPALNETSLLF